ncbi:MAG: hypothetical protein ACP5SH_15760 [Syntrophobacteraceae bacterium]
MGKRALRRRIESLVARIEEHHVKIEFERSKDMPDVGLIRHWEMEIEAFEKSADRARKRLEP